MSNFANALQRLRTAADEARFHYSTVEVDTRDLEDLLREHDRLDAVARLTYEPHVKEARKQLQATTAQLAEFAKALDFMQTSNERTRQIHEQEARHKRDLRERP